MPVVRHLLTGVALGLALSVALGVATPAAVAQQSAPSAASDAHKSAHAAKPANPRPPPAPVVEPSRNAHATKPAAKPSGKPAAKQGTKPVAKSGMPPAVAPADTQATATPAAKPPVDEAKGTVTGLPVPRWASLRTDEVNLRVGPGQRYPIEWVYKRRDLPVQILREFELWRLVEDQDLIKGWVHQATLVGRRNFVVTGGERTLRGSPEDAAPVVAQLKPGVVGGIRSCKPSSDWCEVQVQDYRGFLKRSEFWGTFSGEAVP